MPAYNLICDACGHTFEVTHPMSEPHPKKCPSPECGKRKVRQSFDKPPYFQSKYSPLHPRVNRGRGH